MSLKRETARISVTFLIVVISVCASWGGNPPSLNLNQPNQYGLIPNNGINTRTANSTPAYIPQTVRSTPPVQTYGSSSSGSVPKPYVAPVSSSSYTTKNSSSSGTYGSSSSGSVPKPYVAPVSSSSYTTKSSSSSGTYGSPNFNPVPNPYLAVNQNQSINQTRTANSTPQTANQSAPMNPALIPCKVPANTTYIGPVKPLTNQERIRIEEMKGWGIDPNSATAYSQYMDKMTPENAPEIIRINNDAKQKVYGSEYKGYSSFDIWSSLGWGLNGALQSLDGIHKESVSPMSSPQPQKTSR